MGGTCSNYGEGKGVYRIWVGKPEGKRPLERPRSRWKGNIKVDLQEVGWRVNWNDLPQVREKRRRYRIFGFHQMQRISRLAENLLASQ